MAAARGLDIVTDARVIESANVFEGRQFSVSEAPEASLDLGAHVQPVRPSWGEPYKAVVARMMAAVYDARDAARGHEAVLVSHQLPIWTTRLHVESRSFLHDPRRRQCTLCSLTSLVFDGDDAERAALLRARRGPDPGQGPAQELLLRGWHPVVTRTRRLAVVLAAAALARRRAGGLLGDKVGASGDQGYVAGKGIITPSRRPTGGSPARSPAPRWPAAPLAGRLPRQGRGGQRLGSWCPPCRAEAPMLAAAARRPGRQGRGLPRHQLPRPEQAGPQAFERRFKIPYDSIYDPDGRTLLAFHGTLSPNSIPSTVVIDRQGRVAASVIGAVSRTTLYDLVDDAAGRPGGGA